MAASDMMSALMELCQEKHIDQLYLIDRLEQSLAKSYAEILHLEWGAKVTIDRTTGKIYVYRLEPIDDSMDEEGNFTEFEEIDVTPKNTSRIAAQHAKAEINAIVRNSAREQIYEEFSGRIGDLISGTVLQSTPDFTIVKIREGVEAELPHFDQRRYENERNERPMGERYLHNQHIKAVIIDVRDPNSNLQPVRGEHSRPPIVISRTHPELMRRLFEQEVPEIYEGTVQIKSIAREPGQRSKVAVHSLDVPANDIIKRLFLLGTPLTMTQSMSDDLVELVADDLGRQIKIITPEEENTFSFYDDPADLKPRAPVVTVMGHVDHGKTSLLDAIRHTGVAAGEAGGITQAIGASQVMINDRKITFIDTPGHATFTAMRARGAKVTDIVILIVAADDGVMPQTIESINHAKAAGVPIVVAVNKIDKPGANPDRVRQELTEYGIIPEEWGGQNMFVNISAKQKIGIDDLLETVLLQADVLELKANPDTFASGNVLEAKLDKGRGSVATVLVTRGTLHVGDTLVAGLTYGRVRAMLDPKGNAVTEAGPSDAVEILGLQSVPNAGDEFRVFEDEREARALADERSLKARIEEQSRVKHVTLENLFETIADAEVKELNLIIKADVQGSIEALQDSLDKMDQSEVRINTIHSAVGAINETDVVLADASNAIIIGFGVRPDGKARSAAEREGVEIRCYDVIYKCLEELDAARIGMLKPTEVEVSTGTATVLDTFKVPKVGIAAGVRVEEGEIAATDSVRLVRDGIVVFNGKIASMRHYKDEAKSLKSGSEGGIGLENFQDIKPGDQIEGYRIDQVARTE